MTQQDLNSSSSSSDDPTHAEKGIQLFHDEKPSHYIQADAKEIRRLIWKLDFRLVPYLSLLYLCSFLNRVNIGHAHLAGIVNDLQISDSVYNWSLSIFFIGYVVFEVPANMCLKWMGPRKWIAVITLAWGIIMASMTAVTNGDGLLAARFFLGLAQAGLYPGVIFYLSVWYPRRSQTVRIALFYAASTVAGAFGGVLAYGIMFMNGIREMYGWQWIFLLESLPTLILGLTTYFYLPDYPENSPFLNTREREVLVHLIKDDVGPATQKNFSWKQFFAAFTDWKLYTMSIIALCASTPMYSLSLFMPTIVSGMGFEALTAQLMSAIPYVFACASTVIFAFSADHQKERGFHLTVGALTSTLGYILLITLKDKGPAALFVSATIATCGAFSCIPLCSAWGANNFGGHTKRAVAIGFGSAVGNAGGIISGQIYREEDGPQYIRGHTIILVMVIIVVFTAIGMRFGLYMENRKRNSMTADEYQKACQGTELCDKHPDFRYIL